MSRTFCFLSRLHYVWMNLVSTSSRQNKIWNIPPNAPLNLNEPKKNKLTTHKIDKYIRGCHGDGQRRCWHGCRWSILSLHDLPLWMLHSFLEAICLISSINNKRPCGKYCTNRQFNFQVKNENVSVWKWPCPSMMHHCARWSVYSSVSHKRAKLSQQFSPNAQMFLWLECKIL